MGPPLVAVQGVPNAMPPHMWPDAHLQHPGARSKSGDGLGNGSVSHVYQCLALTDNKMPPLALLALLEHPCGLV